MINTSTTIEKLVKCKCMDCGRVDLFRLHVIRKFYLGKKKGKDAIRWGNTKCRCGSPKLERVKIYDRFTGRKDNAEPVGRQLTLGSNDV